MKLLKGEVVEFPEALSRVIAQLTEGFGLAHMKVFVMALLNLMCGFRADNFEVVGPGEARGADADAEAAGLAPGSEDEDRCACDKPLAKTLLQHQYPAPKNININLRLDTFIALFLPPTTRIV